MALFNKKAMPTTAGDIMKLIKNLSDEEFEKLSDMLLADEDEDGKPDIEDGKPDTMEQVEEAEENIEEKGEDSQTEKDRIDESVGEQEKLEGDEDSQDAKDRVDEAEGEEKALESEDNAESTEEEVEEDAEEEIKEDNKEEVISALEARITELEEKLAKVVESIDGNASFGNYSPDVTEGDGDDTTEDSRIMQAYMKKQAYRR